MSIINNIIVSAYCQYTSKRIKGYTNFHKWHCQVKRNWVEWVCYVLLQSFRAYLDIITLPAHLATIPLFCLLF